MAGLAAALFVVLAAVVSACGGRAESDPQAVPNDPVYDEVNARAVAAGDAWCQIALSCYGPAPTLECYVPTSDGYRAYGGAEGRCEPELDDCHRRLFDAHRDAFIMLRECQTELSIAYGQCLSSCPELGDACVSAYETNRCDADPELSAGFGACFERFCD